MADTPPGSPSPTIGDVVLDSDALPWQVLDAPSGDGVCDGLYGALDGSCRQKYGEHMHGPLVVWRSSDG